MEDFNEAAIKKNCPHCDPESFALAHKLKETKNFWLVCDVHPISSFHLLIMPKAHIACIGDYSPELLTEFKLLYKQASDFIRQNSGSVATFEHGILGQTVFHSHVQMMPLALEDSEVIVPEGKKHVKEIYSFEELVKIYKQENSKGYLFFSLAEKLFLVDTTLAVSRFFRDRFAKAKGTPERGNWKEMHANNELMAKAEAEIIETERAWNNFVNPK